jgi:hypothetical protein
MAVINRGRKWILEDIPQQPGYFRYTTTPHDLSYQDAQGSWQAVDEDLENDGADGYDKKCEKTAHIFRVASGGKRRWTPRRNVPGEYIEITSIQYFQGTWRNLNLPAASWKSNGAEWDLTNVRATVYNTWHQVKTDFILKDSSAPTGLRFAFTLVGLTLNTSWQLVSIADSIVVGRIDTPTALDAVGMDVPVSVVRNGGWVEWQVNTTGAVFPIDVDPTFTDGVGGDVNSAVDTYLSNAATTTNYGTATAFAIRSASRTGLVRFDLSSIPAASTCDSATLYFTNDQVQANNKTISLFRIAPANANWTELGATWNTKDGTNAWAGSVGAETAGTDYLTPASGTFLHTGTDTVGQQYTVSLAASDVQGYFGASFDLVAKSNSSTIVVLASSDHGTSANRPKLVVVYSDNQTDESDLTLRKIRQIDIEAEGGSLIHRDCYFDNFDDGALASCWAEGIFNQSIHDPLVTIAETGGQLVITNRVSQSGSSYNGVYTVQEHNLGNGVLVEVPHITGTGGSTMMVCYLDTDNRVSMETDSNTLYATSRIAGAYSDFNTPYNAVSHRWWRIRYVQSNDTIRFSVSPNGVSDWTEIRSVARGGLPITNMRVYLIGGTWNAIAASYSSFDNFNMHRAIPRSDEWDAVQTAFYSGTEGSWDHILWAAESPCSVIKFGGQYMMYYTGCEGETSSPDWDPIFRRLGVATSPDGITWTKYAGNPILDYTTTGGTNIEEGVGGCAALVVGSTVHMWYAAIRAISSTEVDIDIRYRSSTDGFTFTGDTLVFTSAGDEYMPMGANFDGVTYSLHIRGPLAGGMGALRRLSGTSPTSLTTNQVLTSETFGAGGKHVFISSNLFVLYLDKRTSGQPKYQSRLMNRDHPTVFGDIQEQLTFGNWSDYYSPNLISDEAEKSWFLYELHGTSPERGGQITYRTLYYSDPPSGDTYEEAITLARLARCAEPLVQAIEEQASLARQAGIGLLADVVLSAELTLSRSSQDTAAADIAAVEALSLIRAAATTLEHQVEAQEVLVLARQMQIDQTEQAAFNMAHTLDQLRDVSQEEQLEGLNALALARLQDFETAYSTVAPPVEESITLTRVMRCAEPAIQAIEESIALASLRAFEADNTLDSTADVSLQQMRLLETTDTLQAQNNLMLERSADLLASDLLDASGTLSLVRQVDLTFVDLAQLSGAVSLQSVHTSENTDTLLADAVLSLDGSRAVDQAAQLDAQSENTFARVALIETYVGTEPIEETLSLVHSLECLVSTHTQAFEAVSLNRSATIDPADQVQVQSTCTLERLGAVTLQSERVTDASLTLSQSAQVNLFAAMDAVDASLQLASVRDLAQVDQSILGSALALEQIHAIDAAHQLTASGELALDSQSGIDPQALIAAQNGLALTATRTASVQYDLLANASLTLSLAHQADFATALVGQDQLALLRVLVLENYVGAEPIQEQLSLVRNADTLYATQLMAQDTASLPRQQDIAAESAAYEADETLALVRIADLDPASQIDAVNSLTFTHEQGVDLQSALVVDQTVSLAHSLEDNRADQLIAGEVAELAHSRVLSTAVQVDQPASLDLSRIGGLAGESGAIGESALTLGTFYDLSGTTQLDGGAASSLTRTQDLLLVSEVIGQPIEEALTLSRFAACAESVRAPIEESLDLARSQGMAVANALLAQDAAQLPVAYTISLQSHQITDQSLSLQAQRALDADLSSNIFEESLSLARTSALSLATALSSEGSASLVARYVLSGISLLIADHTVALERTHTVDTDRLGEVIEESLVLTAMRTATGQADQEAVEEAVSLGRKHAVLCAGTGNLQDSISLPVVRQLTAQPHIAWDVAMQLERSTALDAALAQISEELINLLREQAVETSSLLVGGSTLVLEIVPGVSLYASGSDQYIQPESILSGEHFPVPNILKHPGGYYVITGEIPICVVKEDRATVVVTDLQNTEVVTIKVWE